MKTATFLLAMAGLYWAIVAGGSAVMDGLMDGGAPVAVTYGELADT